MGLWGKRSADEAGLGAVGFGVPARNLRCLPLRGRTALPLQPLLTPRSVDPL